MCFECRCSKPIYTEKAEVQFAANVGVANRLIRVKEQDRLTGDDGKHEERESNWIVERKRSE